MTSAGQPPATGGDWLVDLGEQIAHPLDEEIVTIGRDPRNLVMVLDATVSRRHAELVRGVAGWMLSVSGSTGATVNGIRVDAPLAVGPGDRIQLGTHTFELMRGELPAEVVPAATADPALQDPALFKTTASLPAVDRSSLRTTAEHEAVEPRRSPLGFVAAAAILALVVAATCGRIA